jgi:hypothetical protein
MQAHKQNHEIESVRNTGKSEVQHRPKLGGGQADDLSSMSKASLY